MQKITFVIACYGKEINGGAEMHCRMLAERLARDYEVEVLTTCLNNQQTFDKIYEEGTEIINNVLVRRFKTNPFDSEKRKQAEKKARYSRKIRRAIYRLGLSKIVFSSFPVWHYHEKDELELFKTYAYYSTDLIEYLNAHEQENKAIIFMTYYYPYSYFAKEEVYKKAILIPTAHYDRITFHSITSQLFNKVAYIGFNTESEQQMCKNIFQGGMAKNGILSVGVELAPAEPYTVVRDKFDLPAKYLFYFGRISKSKISDLISYFTAYKEKYNDDLYLILTGRLFMPKVTHPYIIYTGFVKDEEKTTLIKHAAIVVNPSKIESLSLLLLEAMQLGKTALVNGHCAVLKEHCIKSNFAAVYYTSKNDFIKKLHKLYTNPQFLRNNEENAKRYVQENYDWDTIIDKFKKIISEL